METEHLGEPAPTLPERSARVVRDLALGVLGGVALVIVGALVARVLFATGVVGA